MTDARDLARKNSQSERQKAFEAREAKLRNDLLMGHDTEPPHVYSAFMDRELKRDLLEDIAEQISEDQRSERKITMGYGSEADGHLRAGDVMMIRFRDLDVNAEQYKDVRFTIDLYSPEKDETLSVGREGIDESKLNPTEHAIFADYKRASPHFIMTDTKNLTEEAVAELNSLSAPEERGPSYTFDKDDSRQFKVPGIGLVQLDQCSGFRHESAVTDTEWTNARIFPEGSQEESKCLHIDNIQDGEFSNLKAYYRVPVAEAQKETTAAKKEGRGGR